MTHANEHTQDSRGLEYPVIDAHCDALLAVIGKSQIPGDTGRRDFLLRNEKSHIDLPKLREGGILCQFMALFAEDEDAPKAYEYTHMLLDEFYAICKKSEGSFFPVLDAVDLSKAEPGKKVAALLSIEGAEALDGKLDALDEFHARGVRALGITWNRRNPFGRGVKAEGEDGLTPLGTQLVEKLEDLRMLIDASHLSDAAFDDLLDVASKPFIASHSNSRSVHDHPRNLTDRQIKSIADSGGAIGAVFVPNFIAIKPAKPFLDSLIDHIDRIVRVGGIESAAMGSDFDGYKGVEGRVIKDASEYQTIPQALASRGYKHADIEKIMFGNWQRVIRDVIK